MQVIILAAGMGRRLRYETADRPKCMVEVSGVSLLQRSLDNISLFSISRIVLVVGYQGGRIRSFVGDSYNGIPVVYVENGEYEITNNIHSLYLARSFLGEDDTVLLEGDIVYAPVILEKLLADKRSDVAVVDAYSPHMDGTVVKISDLHEVVEMIPKADFKPCEADQYYKTVNMYKFSRSFSVNTYIPSLERHCAENGRGQFYEEVLRFILAQKKAAFHALVLQGENWFEIDTIPDLRDAELLFPENGEENRCRIAARYGGYWRLGGLRDFCYLTNPFFKPERFLHEFRQAAAGLLTCYPSGQETQCLLAGQLFFCHENKLAVGNGASELIAALSRIIGGSVGLFFPTFMEYPSRLGEKRIVPLRPPGKGLRYGAEDLIAAAEMADSLFLLNPDNPSGNFIPKKALLDVVAHYGRYGKQVIVDESFVDFADGGGHSLISDDVLESNPNLVVVRSISKTYNVPGVRLGIVASAQQAFIESIRRELAIWNVNSFGEFFLQRAPVYAIEYRNACRAIADERKRFFSALSDVPFLIPLPSMANYILCEVKGKWKSESLAEHLMRNYNIFLKSFSSRQGLQDGEYVRIAVRTREDNQFLVRCLNDSLNITPSVVEITLRYI